MTGPAIEWRHVARPADVDAVRRLVAATGFFSAGEITLAGELVAERLARGAASGYAFLFADQTGTLAGYTCFGPIPCTTASYDLYWIAVDPTRQRAGLGRQLLARSEALIRAAGGTRVYIETSARPQYAPTHAFYRRCGYHQAAFLADFYAPGDGKLIYCKVLERR